MDDPRRRHRERRVRGTLVPFGAEQIAHGRHGRVERVHVGGVGHRVERLADRSLEADLERVVGVDLGDRAMDVHDPLVPDRVPARRRVLDDVVADRDDDVGLIEPEVRVVLDHEPDRSERVRMIVGHRALALEGGGHRDAEPLGEPAERADRAVPRHTGAGEHDRVGRGGKGVGGPLHLVVGRRRIPRDVDLQGPRVGGALGDVFGQHDERRARSFGLGLLERLADHLGRGVAQGDHVAPLRERPVDRHEVDHLVRLLVEAVEAGLRHQGDQRMGVQLRVRDPEHEVERTRAERRQAHAGAARERAVDVGHERGAALVARRHEPDRRVGQRVDHVEVLFTREAEHELDAFVLEALHEELGDVALLPPVIRGSLPLLPSRARR